ncbi:unnamed protein product, partial [Ectocarpus fasciculatus]
VGQIQSLLSFSSQAVGRFRAEFGTPTSSVADSIATTLP